MGWGRNLLGPAVGGSVGALLGSLAAVEGGAGLTLVVVAAGSGWLVAGPGHRGAGGPRRGDWSTVLRRHRTAAAVAVVPAACMVWIRATGGEPSSLALVMVVGGPAAALSLARSAAGVRGMAVRTAAAFALGATVVVIFAVVAYLLVGSIGIGLAAPPIGALIRALDSVAGRVVPLDALTTPGAAALLAFTVVVAPVVEEIVKPAGGIAACPRNRSEAWVLAAASGAGFAVAESIITASATAPIAWFPVLAARTVSAAIPVLGAGIVGLALFDRQQPGEGVSLPRALGLAGLLHAVWNGVVSVGLLMSAGPTAFSPGRPLGPVWEAVSSLLLSAGATAAIWAILRVGAGARSPVSAASFGLRASSPGLASAGWAAAAALVVIPIAWGGSGHPAL